MKPLIKKCIACGKEFTKPVNESKKNWKFRHKFCSKSCNMKFHKFGTKTRFKKGQKAINPIKKGEHRGRNTEFKKGIKVWNKGRHLTVEERKKIADSLPIRRGEKAGNWKGGTTKLGQLIRSCKKYKDWVRKCFIRDKFTCQKCKGKCKKGKKIYLHCHHKKSFYKILEENNIKTLEDALNCKELWNMNNGQTLCIPCHKQTESYLLNQYTK